MDSRSPVKIQNSAKHLRKNVLQKRVWICLASIVLATSTASAVTFSEWTGSTSTDFNTAANWSPSGVPNSTIIGEVDTHSGNQPIIDAENISVYDVDVGVTNNSGANTTLFIQNGGVLNTSGATIGVGNLSNLAAMGSVTITGANSTWNSSGNLEISNLGQANLTITNGGNLSGDNVILGVSTFGFGSLTVDGANSTAYISNLQVGGYGNGSLIITNSGYLSTDSAYVGNGTSASTSPGQYGSVAVMDGGIWTSNEWTYVGYYYPGIVTVSNGGQVILSGLDVGEESGTTGEALVTGSGSSLGTNFGDDIAVGVAGYGNLTVANGGQVNTTSMYIGTYSGGNGTVTITDSGSSLDISGDGGNSNLYLGWISDGNLAVANGGSVIMDGDLLIGQAGGYGVVTQTGGTVSVGGAGGRNLNLNSGIYNLDGGTLRVRNSNGIQGGGTFNWAGGTVQIYGDFSTSISCALTNATSTFDTNGHGGTWAGNLSGAGELTKIGAGELVLSGNNSYTGNTTVSAGTLTLNAPGGDSATGTGSVSVASGATLAGSGYVAGAVSIAGTLSPSGGVIDFAQGLTMESGAALSLSLNGSTRGTQYGAFDVSGNFAIAGNLTVTLASNYTPTAGDTFTLFQASGGSASGTFDNVNLPTLPAPLAWDRSQLYTNGIIVVEGAPQISAGPSNLLVNAGDQANFTVTANATPGPAYQWQLSTDGGDTWSNLRNDATYGGATSAALTVNAVTTGMDGYLYRSVASNGIGTAAVSDPAYLVVSDSPPVFTTQPQNQATTNFGVSAFTVATLGSPAASYTWQVSVNGGSAWSNLSDGGVYSGSDTDTLIITAPTRDMNGYLYRAVADNGFGPNPISDSAELTIKPALTIGTVLSGDPNLLNPNFLTTDGTNLYVSGVTPTGQGIFSVPITGGAATQLYDAFNPQELALLNGNIFWIDPNAGTSGVTEILTAPQDGGGSVGVIYNSGSPIFDGIGLATDGASLYTADELYGRLDSISPVGSNLIQIGPAITGSGIEQRFTIAYDNNMLYIADSGYADTPAILAIPTNGSSFTTLASGTPLVHPAGIAVGDGVIYVSDPGANNTIWAIPEGGGPPTALVSGPPFDSISGLAYANHTLYIADVGGGAIYSLDVTPFAPEITSSPASATITENSLGGPTFAVSAAGIPPSISYQWQISTDNGASWSNLTDAGGFTGTTTKTLTVFGSSLSLNDNQFRCLVGNSVGLPTPSDAATLYVVPPGYISWYTGLGLSGNDALVAATPFTDPLPNLARFAMNLGAFPPTAELPSTAEVNVSGLPYLTLQYRQRKSLSGVQVTVESSTDLLTWTAVPAEDITQLSDDDADTARYEASVPIPASGTIFLRVVYTQSE